MRRIHLCWAMLLLIGEVALATPVQVQSLIPAARVATRNGDIILKVEDFETARRNLLDIAGRSHAGLVDAKTEVNYQGKKDGTLLFRLDPAELDPMMSAVRVEGRIYSETVQTDDRTSEYENLQRRIDLLNKNEQELLAFMHQPRRMRGSDILYVQSRLFESRREASDTAQQRQDLERAAHRSTLRVMLFEPEPRKSFDWGNWHAHASYRGKAAFMGAARKLVTGGFMALWFAPFWIPALVVILLLTRAASRRLRQWRARDR